MGLHEGRIALVTGAGGGIGRATSLIFAREGAKVAVVDIDPKTGKETVALVEKAGGEAIFVEVDVRDESAVEAMIRTTVDQLGRIDNAFNNAGISLPTRRLHEVDAATWEKTIGINMFGVFYCMKHEIAQMLRQDPEGDRRGAIVNTSSGAGYIPAPGQVGYTAAKHGVLGMTKSGAHEYMDDGIRCNAVCPGVIDTPMVQRSVAQNPPEYGEMLKKTVPRGQLGRPEHVAELAVWLCSDQAHWVNGQGIIVDGGMLVR